MEEKKKSNKKLIIVLIAIIVVVVAILGTTYALWNTSSVQEDENELTVGCFDLFFSDTKAISLNRSFPLTDADGNNTEPYTVTLTNNCDAYSAYIVNLEVLNTSDINEKYFKVKVDEKDSKLITNYTKTNKTLTTATNSYQIANGSLATKNATVTHSIRSWMDESVPQEEAFMNKTFEFKITITAAAGTKVESNIIVDIDTNMIPVMYDGTNWVKADMSNSNTNFKWYDYDQQQWANAVLVKETGIKNRDHYIKTAKVGDKIEDADILAFYVYIPRYQYKLFNVDGKDGLGPREIQIEFENNKTAPTINDKNGEWLTHPAFCWGDKCDTERTDASNKEINGIWVGKFETTGTLTANGITIRPNTTAITNQALGLMFNTSRLIQTTTNNVYGFTTDSTKADSHMMKNMEWGAVAYLTNSKYGKNSEVWINNSTTYHTGCAGASVSITTTVSGCAATNQYHTAIGQNASTTGNITGIYDMSGGANEYVGGNMSSSTSSFIFYPSNSGLTAPAAKYYDKYKNSASNTTHERGLLGDATKETITTFGVQTGGWYSDFANFPSSLYSWFVRGGIHTGGAVAGVFAFTQYTGEAHSNNGFRLVYSTL